MFNSSRIARFLPELTARYAFSVNGLLFSRQSAPLTRNRCVMRRVIDRDARCGGAYHDIDGVQVQGVHLAIEIVSLPRARRPDYIAAATLTSHALDKRELLIQGQHSMHKSVRPRSNNASSVAAEGFEACPMRVSAPRPVQLASCLKHDPHLANPETSNA
jgi:hypothetical protein